VARPLPRGLVACVKRSWAEDNAALVGFTGAYAKGLEAMVRPEEGDVEAFWWPMQTAGPTEASETATILRE